MSISTFEIIYTHAHKYGTFSNDLFFSFWDSYFMKGLLGFFLSFFFFLLFFNPAVAPNYAVSEAVWCDLTDDELWRAFGSRPQRVSFFGVRVCSLTGHGYATHCQVQTLVSWGNWLGGGPYVFSISHSLWVSALLFDLLPWYVSQCLLGKSSKWRQMPWSFTAFSILTCCDTYCTLREQALVFPFLFKPQAPSVVI